MGIGLGYTEADLNRLLELAGGGPLCAPEDVRRIIDGYRYLDDWRADYRIQSVRSALHSSRITCIDAAILSYGLLEIVCPEVQRRLLAIQALESARCIEEKVVTDVREADVGSILGFGFAPFTGGTLSYIDGMGARTFVDLCNRLAASCGERFKPCKLLIDMAKKGDTFYHRFPPGKRKAVA